ncbi:MAG: prephenate dehydrogenase/arogenate dehydrogenase family protein, partial [Candidatus Moraniibacteriota bacterium]
MNKITQSTFGIIGNGRFGKIWSEAIKSHGTVKIFDKKSKTASMKKLKETLDCDILFLLVPISEMEKICKKISPLLNKKTIVIDACSVKERPAQIMKKWLPEDQPIIASHPLFGPESTKKIGLKGQKIVCSPIRATKNQITTFEILIQKIGLKIIKETPEKHDKEMASSQA